MLAFIMIIIIINLLFREKIIFASRIENISCCLIFLGDILLTIDWTYKYHQIVNCYCLLSANQKIVLKFSKICHVKMV